MSCEIDPFADVDALRDRISQLESDCASYRKALEKIASPQGITTSGDESKEEYEELYDFWHMVACDRLNIAKEALSLAGGKQMLERFEAECIEIVKGWGEFRGKIRQLLHENGVASNPGWTEADIIDALRAKLAESERVRSDDESAIILLGKRLALAERCVAEVRKNAPPINRREWHHGICPWRRAEETLAGPNDCNCWEVLALAAFDAGKEGG